MPQRQTRYLATELDTPVRSALRRRKAATIPPFAFVGELERAQSGIWYPTSTTILSEISVIASGPGRTEAGFTLYKKEPSLFPDATPATEIMGIRLGIDGKKVIASLGNTVVTPHDKVFIQCWDDSGHPNVVVQMVGVIMT